MTWMWLSDAAPGERRWRGSQPRSGHDRLRQTNRIRAAGEARAHLRTLLR